MGGAEGVGWGLKGISEGVWGRAVQGRVRREIQADFENRG